MNDQHTMGQLVIVTLVALTTMACGPGEVNDQGPGPADALPDDADVDAGVVGDPWHCGELDEQCVVRLGIGECIDGECQAHVAGQCWSPAFAPSCDAYCESLDESCAYLGCEGATAFAWMGEQAEADAACLNSVDNYVAMTVTCEQPLEGLVTTVLCCCT